MEKVNVRICIIFLLFFALTSEANAQVIVVNSEFKGHKWNGFCYPVDEDAFPDGYGECNYQRDDSFDDLFNPQNGYCHFESSHLDYLKDTKRIKIENNFVVDGDRFIYILLRKYYGACSILVLKYVNNSNNSILLSNALHLVYTQYADSDSWPMPTKKLQKKWIAKFGNKLHFTNEQCLFIFNEWYKYLKKNLGKERRWLPRNPQY